MDPIQALLLRTGQKAGNFPPSSRYRNVETAELMDINRESIVYLKRRFLPQPASLSTFQTHIVKPDERLDYITHQHLGDSEQFWQICDANAIMHPLEATEEANRVLRITLPLGIPV